MIKLYVLKTSFVFVAVSFLSVKGTNDRDRDCALRRRQS